MHKSKQHNAVWMMRTLAHLRSQFWILHPLEAPGNCLSIVLWGWVRKVAGAVHLNVAQVVCVEGVLVLAAAEFGVAQGAARAAMVVVGQGVVVWQGVVVGQGVVVTVTNS